MSPDQDVKTYRKARLALFVGGLVLAGCGASGDGAAAGAGGQGGAQGGQGGTQSGQGGTQSGGAGLGGSSDGGSDVGGTGGGGGPGGAAGEGGGGGSGATGGSGGGSLPVSCDAPAWADEDFAVVYEVGPDRQLETPSDVPWEDIGPSTLVKIHARSEPYRDKWVLNYPGTETEPVVVLGVPEDGRLPVISGDGAVTRTEIDFTGEDRSVIKVGTSNVPDNGVPSYIAIECLDIQSAKPEHSYSDDNGDAQSYADNAATITIETGDHITIRNCTLHDAGNGLFSAWQSSNVLVSGNYIHDNGNVDSIYEHNSYTESSGIVFELNHYGPLCDGCLGNNLKDRSAGTVIRYNWIEDGNRQLDLVESDHEEITSLSSYGETHVYGNVLVEGDGEGNGQIVHYGGDGGGQYRAGTLHFYHNTVVSTRSGNTTLLRLSTNDEAAAVLNNVLYAAAGGARLAMLDAAGSLELSGNFLPEGWQQTHGSLEGQVSATGNTEGGDPGFVDLSGQDFRLQASSPAVGAAGDLPAGARSLPVELQYDVHQSATPRAGTSDSGAFEHD